MLVVVLAVTAGATDATAFERLGHVFASVITGNLVLLGISAVHTDGRLALSAGCALAGYGAGVLLAAPRRGELARAGPLWPAAATVALAADLALLAAFAVVWEADGPHFSRTAEIIALVLCSAAMGVQSTAVRRLGAMSTTYLTSTLTALLEALVARQWKPAHGRSAAILLAAIAGAAAAVALIIHAPAWLPVAQLVPLAIVLPASLPLIRGRCGATGPG